MKRAPNAVIDVLDPDFPIPLPEGEFRDRRKHHRIAVTGVKANLIGVASWPLVINLSREGILIETREPIRPARLYHLELTLTRVPIDVDVQATVAYCEVVRLVRETHDDVMVDYFTGMQFRRVAYREATFEEIGSPN